MQKFNPTCLFAVHPDMERGVALLSRVVEYPYLASLGYVMVVVYWGEGEIMDIDSSYYDYVLSSRLAPAQRTGRYTLFYLASKCWYYWCIVCCCCSINSSVQSEETLIGN